MCLLTSVADVVAVHIFNLIHIRLSFGTESTIFSFCEQSITKVQAR